MADEQIVVTGEIDNWEEMRLKIIRETYNCYIEKLERNPKYTINMSQYCEDVRFLLIIIRDLIHENEN